MVVVDCSWDLTQQWHGLLVVNNRRIVDTFQRGSKRRRPQSVGARAGCRTIVSCSCSCSCLCLCWCWCRHDSASVLPLAMICHGASSIATMSLTITHCREFYRGLVTRKSILVAPPYFKVRPVPRSRSLAVHVMRHPASKCKTCKRAFHRATHCKSRSLLELGCVRIAIFGLESVRRALVLHAAVPPSSWEVRRSRPSLGWLIFTLLVATNIHHTYLRQPKDRRIGLAGIHECSVAPALNEVGVACGTLAGVISSVQFGRWPCFFFASATNRGHVRCLSCFSEGMAADTFFDKTIGCTT